MVLLIIFQIKPEAAYLYDAVWLYAKAVHGLLRDGLDYHNGSLVIDRIKQTTYQSKYIMRYNHICKGYN